ncbi:inner membrane protein [Betaproteobacteria bacterium MOLA814]|jgi:multiple antibiotic resistance protein|nr:inner membrane protein [Betaproteobacteria bacterium MOLA814]
MCQAGGRPLQDACVAAGWRVAPFVVDNERMDFKPLITLIAIVNPLAIVPFFMHYTQGFNRTQIRRTIQVAALSSFAVIAICALFGLAILAFFGISLASFQVGGGLLMLTSALSMINARAAEAAAHDEDVDSIDGSAVAPVDHSQHSVAVVPLTIPLLTGPATMSTVVIYADQAQTFWQHAALLGYGVVIAVLTFACFSTAPAISRVLGKTGINVMTRLMGLILAALSVEVIAKGLQQLFPVLAG